MSQDYNICLFLCTSNGGAGNGPGEQTKHDLAKGSSSMVASGVFSHREKFEAAWSPASPTGPSLAIRDRPDIIPQSLCQGPTRRTPEGRRHGGLEDVMYTDLPLHERLYDPWASSHEHLALSFSKGVAESQEHYARASGATPDADGSHAICPCGTWLPC